MDKAKRDRIIALRQARKVAAAGTDDGDDGDATDTEDETTQRSKKRVKFNSSTK
jgi:hypothetical protein